MGIGKKIGCYLRENGIKQSFLAEQSGLGNDIICNIIKGKRKVSASEYFKICKALKVSLDYFFEEVEEETACQKCGA